MSFPADIKGCMKDCILSLIWPRKEIRSFFLSHGCTSADLRVIDLFEQMNRAQIIDTMFEHLSARPDNGLGPFRAMLQGLLAWDRLDPYYFDKLRKLDRSTAEKNLQHLRQLQEIRDSKIKADREQREARAVQSQKPTVSLEQLRAEFLSLHAGNGRMPPWVWHAELPQEKFMSDLFLPVSVVIPSFNRPDGVRNLLRTFRAAQFRCEIVLIDDHSKTDLTTIAHEFSELRILWERNERNMGPAQCRNRGILRASQEYVAFTDDDCLVSETWLAELYDTLTTSDKSIAGVGGRVLAEGNDTYGAYYEYHKILDPWYFKGQYVYLVTANSIFRKAPLVEVGGFDTQMKVPGGEDPGLCFKLLNRGYRFLYNPDALVHHQFRRGVFSFIKTFYRYGFGCAVQSSKHFQGVPDDGGEIAFGGARVTKQSDD